MTRVRSRGEKWDKIEEEELQTVSEAITMETTGGDHEEVSSQSLKIAPSEVTLSARLDAIKEEVNEALAAKEDASISAEPILAWEPSEIVPVVDINPTPEP